ncbi:unnamed protein product [Trifolium pratense]|uniref:Uncharacterized protein n=1 Tax=Trifolium pratense TaxID=57577 RepID=A0ACB0KEY5_TRIPR|nr:unnamed protein product [Trifolium pratense]
MDREMVVDNGDSVNNDDLINDINQVKSQLKQITNVKMGYEIQLLNVLMEDIDKRQRICIVVLLCHIVHALHLLEMILPRHARNPTIRDHYEKERRRVQLMTHLVQTERCRDIIRMSPAAFMKLCEKLRSTGIVKDSTKATIEEQVAKFLHIVGHNVKNRTVSFFFHRSGETDCIGAIDGTHSRVKVRRADAPRFRGRKEYTTQNVFAACSFDMKFTYVLSGWEGTASDSRILKDALSREDSLLILEGKYYLGDAGFPLKGGILTPYRGVRYHLKEYSARGPQNHKELFNLRHSSLRNVTERTFGVLKKRFPIIGGGNEPYYSFPVMTDIFIACCILHNYLMGVDIDNQIIAEVDQELQQRGIDRSSTNQCDEDYRQGANIRENVSTGMWNEYPL